VPDSKPLFGDLRRLCHALDSVGMPTGGDWKKIPDWDYQCISSYREFGPDAPNRSDIAYYVTGNSADRADEVKIVVNLNVRSSEAESRKVLLRAAAQWFKAVDLPMPAELVVAIQSNRPFKGTVANYRVAYWSEQPGNILEKYLTIS
jgi:hypothetical protein